MAFKLIEAAQARWRAVNAPDAASLARRCDLSHVGNVAAWWIGPWISDHERGVAGRLRPSDLLVLLRARRDSNP
jgi:hypothetical protein